MAYFLQSPRLGLIRYLQCVIYTCTACIQRSAHVYAGIANYGSNPTAAKNRGMNSDTRQAFLRYRVDGKAMTDGTALSF